MAETHANTAARVSPAAMLVFLKQAALEDHWTASYLGTSLGLDRSVARQVASEMALAGYIEPVAAKKDTWRNTAAGNRLAGASTARLTRAKAEALLADVEDRAAEAGTKDLQAAPVEMVVAFGSILGDHDPIQDVDIGVRFQAQEGQTIPHAQQTAALKFLKGRSPALKFHVWDAALAHLPARIIWKA